MQTHALELPATKWRIGDLVGLGNGNAATVTLHRLEGAPPRVVVEFAGLAGHHRYPPTTTATVWRSPSRAA